VAAIAAVLLLPACMMTGGPPPGNAEKGYNIWGFVGESSTEAASNTAVVLLDDATGETVSAVKTNIWGKYAFTRLKPGVYRLNTGKIEMRVEIADEDHRVDIDLSSPDGKMDYVAGSVPGAGEEKEAEVGKPRADPQAAQPVAGSDLAQQLQGVYWGYSGSTETKIGLCPGGRYHDYSESNYSGQFTDGMGNQTGAWGAAGQNQGAGNWTVNGNLRGGTITVVYSDGNQSEIEYRAGAEAGCYYFGNRQLCRTGACE
jgi:hypothetical protein